ncbi:hypothetical protein OG225_42810 (plasmid) [Nocardia sp. NBC_01377]|uniref:hypothetical protein n=1 Tax=Nocardia sp. NBC_01377 TaxID=2903595 RepID=UPI002F910E1B
MSEWDIVTEAVTEHAVALRTMSTHGEIYKWAKDNDLTSRTLFPKLKAQLRKQLGIDYEQLRESATEQRAEELAVAAAEAPQIVLWVAADAEAGSFAVCDSEGEALWYGTFHPDDRYYRKGDQVSASLSAAEKAVYIAGQARREAELDTVRLRLLISDHRVDTTTLTGSGVTARVLIHLKVSESQNPALDWCRAPGFKSWRESRLDTLIGDAEAPQ